MSETRERQARELAAIIEEHIPLESCAGEPGDAGCSCGEAFSGEYTWKGYCAHLAGKLARALAACALEVLREINADAEADMLKGNPITGAHRRAIERRIAALERAAGEGKS